MFYGYHFNLLCLWFKIAAVCLFNGFFFSSQLLSGLPFQRCEDSKRTLAGLRFPRQAFVSQRSPPSPTPVMEAVAVREKPQQRGEFRRTEIQSRLSKLLLAKQFEDHTNRTAGQIHGSHTWPLELPGGLVKTTLLSFWFRSSGWGLRVCVSYLFPGDTDAAGLRTTLWEPLD